MKNSQTYPFINALLASWKATGKPFGIDAYLRITQLVEALPDDTHLADLKTLLAPIIVGSPQQQADFYETFERVLKNFDAASIIDTPVPPLLRKMAPAKLLTTPSENPGAPKTPVSPFRAR